MPRFDLAPAGGPLVRGFRADGSFIVDGDAHRALLLTTERVIAWDPPPRPELTMEHFEPVFPELRQCKLLLFGSGKMLGRLPRPVMSELLDWGIGVEAMDSRAAARTWAVLRAEERRLVAALMPLA